MNDTSSETAPESKLERVESKATKDPAVRLFILAAMLLGFGVYCLVDDIRGEFQYVAFSESINGWCRWAFNHYGPYVLIPPGVVVLIRGILFLRRKLVADSEGIGYDGKEKIPWDQVTELDATELQSKKVLRVYYGEGKKLVLDSWKLQDFRDLVAVVEQNIPPNLVKR